MRSLPQTFVLAIGCLSGMALAAQELKPTAQLRTTSGQMVFHIGERISLTVTLTGPDNKKYSIDTAGYDRSGRLMIDAFDASPATGWADPLQQYFSEGDFMGGGLHGSAILSSKPVSFTADLNEQIRFDQPGTYTVTATSHRVGTNGKDSFPGQPYLALVSNPIQIQIIPATPEWQAEKLRSTLAVLAAPVKQKSYEMPSAEREAAFADLRFLNSPAAIELLASYLRDDSDNHLMWAAALGLAGVPDSLRETAIHAMSRQLEDPDFPVGSFFSASWLSSRPLRRTLRPRHRSSWRVFPLHTVRGSRRRGSWPLPGCLGNKAPRWPLLRTRCSAKPRRTRPPR